MTLHSNWFLEPIIDFEYKKFQLLAYLKVKKEELDAHKLYPHIDELNSHKKTLEQFINSKKGFEFSLKKEFDGIDLEQQQVRYKNSFAQDQGLEEMMQIITYSHSKIVSFSNHFNMEWNELKRQLRLDVVGLLPDYQREGFLIIRQRSGIFVFSYLMNPVLLNDGAKDFATRHLFSYKNSLANTENSIKKDVIELYREINPNPAVFSISTTTDLPLYETLLPLCRQELDRYIN